jgi:hypothetical protein
MLAWLLSADGDIDEIDVDVHGVLCLSDDKLIRIVSLIGALTDDKRCTENSPSRVCDDDVS